MRACCRPQAFARAAFATVAMISSTTSAICAADATHSVTVHTTCAIVAMVSVIVGTVSITDAVVSVSVLMLCATVATNVASGAAADCCARAAQHFHSWCWQPAVRQLLMLGMKDSSSECNGAM